MSYYLRAKDRVMSMIPSNVGLVGALAQTQVSAKESAKTQNSQKNQRTIATKEAAKLAKQKEEEVQDATDVEDLYVHRNLDGETGGDTHDRYEPAAEHEPTEAEIQAQEAQEAQDRENAIFSTAQPINTDLPDEARGINHIDLSA